MPPLQTIALSLLSRLPLSVRASFGALCGLMASLLPSRDRRVAKLQLALFMPELKGPATIARVYANLGRAVLECCNLNPILKDRAHTIICPNRALIDRLYASGRPIIALSAHLSNWELLAAWAVAEGYPLATVGRPARQAGLQDILNVLRERHGVRTFWRGSQADTKQLVRALKAQTIIAALIDQDIDLPGVFCPFFSTPAFTASGIIELGKRTEAQFISAFIVRNKQSFTVHLEQIDDQGSIEAIIQTYHTRLEQLIRAHPEQWVWFHKRWRTRPKDGRLSSTQYLNWLESSVHSESS